MDFCWVAMQKTRHESQLLCVRSSLAALGIVLKLMDLNFKRKQALTALKLAELQLLTSGGDFFFFFSG